MCVCVKLCEYTSATMKYHDANTIYYVHHSYRVNTLNTCDIEVLLHRFGPTQHLVVFEHQTLVQPRTAPRFIKYNLMRSLHEQEQ